MSLVPPARAFAAALNSFERSVLAPAVFGTQKKWSPSSFDVPGQPASTELVAMLASSLVAGWFWNGPEPSRQSTSLLPSRPKPTVKISMPRALAAVAASFDFWQ